MKGASLQWWTDVTSTKAMAITAWEGMKQDRMSTDAIEGLRDSQDLDDWQYNNDSYNHLQNSNIHFAEIFKYPYFRYLNMCTLDISISQH